MTAAKAPRAGARKASPRRPTDRLRVGIVGCGNIAGPYARDIVAKPNLELVALTDLDPARAEALAAQHGARAVPTLDDLLSEDVDLVVNLTFQGSHAATTRRALEAGKHVHSEKPLALSSGEAWELVELANRRGVRLGCSPFTLLGEAQQTAWRELRSGRTGPIRAVFADVDWGRIETWHPAPVPFYEVGVLVDVGVYPLTILTAILGPARRVQSVGRLLLPDRTTLDGTPFRIETPDLQVTLLDLESGATVRLTTSFYVGQQAKSYASVAFHGDLGTVWLDHFFKFDAAVEFAEFGDRQGFKPVPHVRKATGEIDWGRAVADLADAIAEGRPHRATGEQAAHIVDVFLAAAESARTGRPVDVASTFRAPAPMPWAE
jgi:predicted dehydrogenase